MGDHQELGGRVEQVRGELALQAGVQRDSWLIQHDDRRGGLAEHGRQDKGLPRASAGELDRDLGVQARGAATGVDGNPDGRDLSRRLGLAVLVWWLLDLNQAYFAAAALSELRE